MCFTPPRKERISNTRGLMKLLHLHFNDSVCYTTSINQIGRIRNLTITKYSNTERCWANIVISDDEYISCEFQNVKEAISALETIQTFIHTQTGLYLNIKDYSHE